MAQLRVARRAPICSLMSDDERAAGTVSPIAAGLGCRCPRCGRGSLFGAGFTLSVREHCPVCGLDFAFVDPGDGPAVFAILILGFLILGAALVLEFRVHPPLWVHIATWAPVTFLLAFGMLRPLKAVLVALQYHHKATQARSDGDHASKE